MLHDQMDDDKNLGMGTLTWIVAGVFLIIITFFVSLLVKKCIDKRKGDDYEEGGQPDDLYSRFVDKELSV